MDIYRNFCFTINNYTDDDKAKMLLSPYQYITYGHEVAPTTGTPHLQGYCELKKPVRKATMKDFFPRASLFHRKGTQKQALEYAQKGLKNIFEIGTPKKQGERVDLDGIRELALDAGMRVITSCANMQQIRVAEKFLTYNEPERNEECNVIWVTGPSGSGKGLISRQVIAKDEDVYQKDGTKWWDGYDGHQTIIIDDFRDSWWDLTFMLKLLDRYALRVEVKGGYRQIRATKIIVNSIKHPTECYLNTGECKNQLLRRIKTTIVLTSLEKTIEDYKIVLQKSNT